MLAAAMVVVGGQAVGVRTILCFLPLLPSQCLLGCHSTRVRSPVATYDIMGLNFLTISGFALLGTGVRGANWLAGAIRASKMGLSPVVTLCSMWSLKLVASTG